MESVKKANNRHGTYTVCPATGLPVYSRPEWTNVMFGKNYQLSVSIIGDNILVGKVVGVSDIRSVVAATQFVDEIIIEMFGRYRAFVYVEDLTELKKLPADLKHYNARYLKNKDQLKAVIICTLSSLAAIAIKFINRFNILSFVGIVEKDMPTAVKRAVDILSSVRPGNLTHKNVHQASQRLVTGGANEKRCAVTGLRITEKPEWTRVDLGGPSVTFRFIGNRILSSDLHDWNSIDIEVCRKLFALRRRVLDSMLKPDERFVELRNYKEFSRGACRVLRDEFIRLMTPDRERLLAYVGYDAPLTVRLGFNVGQKLHSSPFPWKISSDYNAAVNSAILTLRSHGFSDDGVLNAIKNDDWKVVFDDFVVRFEVIDGNILHRISSGYLHSAYIDKIYHMQDRIIKETTLDSQPFYFLNGVEGVVGTSLRARKRYFNILRTWMDIYPSCQMNMVYGANRMVQAGFNITNYLRPYHIKMADTLEESVQIISAKKAKDSGRTSFRKEAPGPEDTEIKNYADELLSFLGNINWEIDGFNEVLNEKDDNHPFKTVFDAVALIKMDIDELFRERQRTQKALKEGEEALRALLNATSDSSLLLSTDGTILSANETFAKRLSRDSASLKDENISSFIDPKLIEHRIQQQERVVATGKPVRFEDEDEGLCYDNTIYPVYSAEGEVDRLALYSRDITQLKEAEKHIQALTQEIIKAQENERQRIARDLHDNVAQDLASLIISSDTMFEGYQEIPHEVKRRTMKFSRVLKRAISSIRDLAYDLRPPSLDQLGLVRTLSQYCNDFSETHMVSVDFYSAGLEKLNLDFDTEINIYRLIQEALNNVKKHAESTHITIRLVTSFPDIILRVEDDGMGFDPDKRIAEALNEKRMGLKSMEERVKLLSGEFTIRSRPGEGTLILVKLPLDPGSEGAGSENRPEQV